MRLIEFRAWDIKQQKMYYNVGFSMCGIQIYRDQQMPEIVILDKGKDLFKLMQFTSLLDQNGKKIFEGDIVKNKNNQISKIIYGETDYAIGFTLSPMWGYGWEGNEVEVMGNIYENPDLLPNGIDKL